MRTVHLIGAPLDLGGARRGTDMGPSAFRIAGLADHLAALGITVVDKGDIQSPIPETKGPGDSRKRYVKEIGKVCQKLYQVTLAGRSTRARFPSCWAGITASALAPLPRRRPT